MNAKLSELSKEKLAELCAAEKAALAEKMTSVDEAILLDVSETVLAKGALEVVPCDAEHYFFITDPCMFCGDLTVKELKELTKNKCALCVDLNTEYAEYAAYKITYPQVFAGDEPFYLTLE